MDRPLAARLIRPLGGAREPPRRTAPRARGGRRRAARPPRPLALRLPPAAARALLAALSRRRRLRLGLLVLLLALAPLAGGWLWLRDSSLVAVRNVRISGVQGPQAGAIEAALAAAARRMSTLDVNTAALRAAAAPFPVVRALRASASFPSTLRIRVVEQLPVAALTVGGVRTAVAADGVALGPGLLSGSLPTLAGAREPAPGARVGEANVREALAVLGVAPAALAPLIARAYSGPKGLTLAMRNGLLAYFGDSSRPHAKWLALARVLADPGSAGASYIDVRLPERPAAGFPSGVTPPAASAAAGGGGQAAGGETPAGALAGALAPPAGANGGGQPGAAAGGAQAAGGTGEAGGSGASEAGAGNSSAAGAASAAEGAETAGGAGG